MNSDKNQQKTVLIIEDERPLLSIIKEKLERQGMDVITSQSVNRAFSVEIAKNPGGRISISTIELALSHLNNIEKIDAVWLDHNLLGSETGIDFVTKFKANGGRFEDVPIFVVSNTADPGLLTEYAELGVHSYYGKAEHTLDEIVADIEKTLRGVQKIT